MARCRCAATQPPARVGPIPGPDPFGPRQAHECVRVLGLGEGQQGRAEPRQGELHDRDRETRAETGGNQLTVAKTLGEEPGPDPGDPHAHAVPGQAGLDPVRVHQGVQGAGLRWPGAEGGHVGEMGVQRGSPR